LLNVGLPIPKNGDDGRNATLKVGTVTTLPYGNPATVEITGTGPEQVANFSIPAGKDASDPIPTSFTVGSVTQLASNKAPTVEITGDAPKQTINFGIPAGASATPANFETLVSKVVAAGTPVNVTFAKKYSVPPVVLPNPIWNGDQLVMGQASDITVTGCKVIVKQSVGTLLLNGSPFNNAPKDASFSMFVIGN